MKRITVTMWVALLLLVMMFAAQTAWADSTFSGGDGSEDNPYQIATTADLDQLATDVNSGTSYKGVHFLQTADITYEYTFAWDDPDSLESNFTPIGNLSYPFKGTFRGNGYKISGVRIDTGLEQLGGLFGGVVDATLDGITIEDARVMKRNYYTGILVGSVDGRSVINNCSVSGLSKSTSFYTGGLAGAIGDGSVITNCSASGVVISTNYAGGLVGGCVASTFTIRDCVSSAEVIAGEYTGGLIGYINCEGAEITGSRADGYVSGAGSVGGFVGYIGNSSTVTISNCVARGDVRSSGSGYGGFVGTMDNSNATISDCWCSGAVWGTAGDIGAFVGKLRKGTSTNNRFYPYSTGARPFCGNDLDITGGQLTQAEYNAYSANWPEVKKHRYGVKKITNADELLAINNDLSGSYIIVCVNGIDFAGRTIVPIGDNDHPFTGELYGQGHKVRGYYSDSRPLGFLDNLTTSSPFYSDTTDIQYAGLFGKISGGRVSGVRAEGSVTGNPTVSGTDVGTGGFAGKIDSKSLIDDCSFIGDVTSESSSNVGGFVGYTVDSPVILRCCADGVPVTNSSSRENTGGFIGRHYGGYITDCYAAADVTSVGKQTGGFAGYISSSARIATSWCAGEVSSRSAYRGAFVGQPDGSGLVTNSYFNSDVNGDLKASGNNITNGSVDYAGITGLDWEAMMMQDSFEGFDFDAVWTIDDEWGHPVFPSVQHVTFDPTGGTCDPASADYVIGDDYGLSDKIELPVPVRPGYNFIGWFDDLGVQVFWGSYVTFHTHRTLYARWSNVTYSVNFDANGGTGDEMASMNFTYDEAQNLPANSYTRACYEFAGWATTADGDVVYTDGQSVSNLADTQDANVTLYAKWTENVLELADAADNTTAIADAAANGKTYNRVILQDRTLYKDDAWNTLCLPFDIDDFTGTPLEGATVMELDATGDYEGKKTGFDVADGTLYLYFKSAETIEACRPYIVKWPEDTNVVSPVFSVVTINSTPAEDVTLTDGKYIVSASNDGLNTVEFIGSFSPVSLTPDDKSNLFIGDANTLYYPNAANNDDDTYHLNACRAYFHVDLEEPTNAVRAFVLKFEEKVTTGIAEASPFTLHSSLFTLHSSLPGWYSLDGRKLSGKPTQQGIYLNNGRKVVIPPSHPVE